MPGATLSTLSAVLKDFYLPPVVDQLNNEVFLFSKLDTSNEELVGNRAVVPLHTTRTGGIGPAAENAALPAATAQRAYPNGSPSGASRGRRRIPAICPARRSAQNH